MNANRHDGFATEKPVTYVYRVRPRRMAAKANLDLDKARALADRLEDDQVLRKKSADN